ECVTLNSSVSTKENVLKRLSMYACEKREVIPGHMNLALLEWVDMTLFQRLRNFPEISRNISWFSISVEELEKVPESIRLWYHLRVLTITSKGKLKLLAHLSQGVTHLQISDIGVQWMSCRKKCGQRVQNYL
ncbi:unnamed protein product, partial [Brassica oleracea]